MASFTGMRHIHLKVADIERSVRFYEEGLGMKEVMTKHEGQMVILTTPDGGDVLTLSQGSIGADVDASGRIGDNGGIDHFGFTMADQNQLDQAIEQLVAAGATFIKKSEIASGFPTAFLRDPDGYAFQI
jgi:catechol 2,3-dioxygenase-like lactoylglutathione lyase family enzyme